ncbi:hypothetical protein BKA70DRAFT_1220479 [Coprinopsis sp. MPI-PUGE-AT-0042]|nr:hypothetical protein BKA70DRAFT_1220479 [Coprinopsis sp. MPI-PUGE-AT-0042]
MQPLLELNADSIQVPDMDDGTVGDGDIAGFWVVEGRFSLRRLYPSRSSSRRRRSDSKRCLQMDSWRASLEWRAALACFLCFKMDHDEAGVEMGLKRADQGTDAWRLGAGAAADEEGLLTRLVRPDEGPSERISAALKSYVRAGRMLAIGGSIWMIRGRSTSVGVGAHQTGEVHGSEHQGCTGLSHFEGGGIVLGI